MARAAGKNLKYLRENNTKEIIKYLTVHGETSRVQLSKVLGLSKMTISNIVSELIGSGIITETGVLDHSENITTGPKPVLLALSKNKILSIGIYISRERILAALTDIAGGELCFEEISTKSDCNEQTLIHHVIGLIRQVIEYARERDGNIAGIGIAMVGLVDSKQGVFVKSTGFLEDHKVHMKNILEEEFSYPVYVQNDMQASALAEQIYGLGRECSNYVYIGITNGIGTAVVSNGKVLTGSRGFAVEAGHMSVDFNGAPCSCGNRGCLELYTSLPVLLKQTGAKSAADLMLWYRNKDKRTVEVMEEFIRVFSIALINLSNIFDIDKIIIGYEGALFDKDIYTRIEDNINRACLWRYEKKVQVEISSLKSLGPIRGAATLVFHDLYMEQHQQ